MLALSVVVPATDRPPTLPVCLAAIERAAGNHEVVVVDGPPGLSACTARNAGARRATGDVLVFVDSDVEIHPDALTRVKAAFAARPELTAVFGSYDDAPSAGGTVAAFRNTSCLTPRSRAPTSRRGRCGACCSPTSPAAASPGWPCRCGPGASRRR